MTQIIIIEKEMFKADVRKFDENTQGQQIKTYQNKQLEMVPI